MALSALSYPLLKSGRREAESAILVKEEGAGRSLLLGRVYGLLFASCVGQSLSNSFLSLVRCAGSHGINVDVGTVLSNKALR